MSLSRKPYSLSCASPICPLSKFVISSSFLTFIFFFSSNRCFFIYMALRSYSSCLRRSAMAWNYLVRFSGPFNLKAEVLDCALLLLSMDSSKPADTFLLNSSECSTCSSLVIPNLLLSSYSRGLLPILWLLSRI